MKVVRENTDVPCAIGFGISTPEQAQKMAETADGVIIGLAIIRILEKYGKDAPAFILMRQEDSDFYKSEMNCRQPVRADFFLDNSRICC